MYIIALKLKSIIPNSLIVKFYFHILINSKMFVKNYKQGQSNNVT